MTHRWHKPAILGSVWASIEIVLGSFLHNLKFPLTGTILSAIGISLLVAGHSLWKEQGIVWRAGIICAVMKSVSPSAVIFGPMIGITVEAFIVEMAIRILGGGTVAYIAGGAVACTTPLIQKTVSYLFVYGMNIVTVFDKMVDFAAKSLSLPFIDSSDVVISIIFINLIFGGFSAAIGLIIGEKARSYSKQRSTLQLSPIHSENLRSPQGQFSILRLLLHFTILVSGLIVHSIYFVLYIPACIYLYPVVRKRFSKISFWIEICLVSIVAGLILGQFSLSDRSEGLRVGLQMFLRAVFVVSIFGAITVELRNPAIINFLFRRHMKNFLIALDTAFSALPTIIDSLQQEKFFFRHPINSLSRVLARAEEMIPMQKVFPKIFILTGEKDSGKTRLVEETIAALKSKGLKVGGIIQRKVTRNGERCGYDVLDIRTYKGIPLCRTDAPNEGIVAGPFKFFPEGIRFGAESLSISKIKECDVVVVDEVGPLEMKGRGWHEAVSNLLGDYSGNLLIVIRKHLVDEITKLFDFDPMMQWNSKQVAIEEIVKHIRTTARGEHVKLLHKSNSI